MTTVLPSSTPSGPGRTARVLGYAGLIPFVGAAFCTWFFAERAQLWASAALLAYGAVIASFLGGIHWGRMLHGAPSPGVLVWGVVPSLVAWGTVFVPRAAGLAVLAALLVLCWLVDRRLYDDPAARAWLPMRMHLTMVAAASCVFAAWQIA